MSKHVIVVGSGNAALCAALAALEEGADVLILEKADADHPIPPRDSARNRPRSSADANRKEPPCAASFWRPPLACHS
ncbi:FAD-binding protein [Dinoroseobacter sp. S375]|uniref:FAD-binding protein n=1 Tax=Dinoroseobacter sp. S375 TaxID=3415136 RepID=UPI003C7D306B